MPLQKLPADITFEPVDVNKSTHWLDMAKNNQWNQPLTILSWQFDLGFKRHREPKRESFVVIPGHFAYPPPPAKATKGNFDCQLSSKESHLKLS